MVIGVWLIDWVLLVTEVFLDLWYMSSIEMVLYGRSL